MAITRTDEPVLAAALPRIAEHFFDAAKAAADPGLKRDFSTMGAAYRGAGELFAKRGHNLTQTERIHLGNHLAEIKNVAERTQEKPEMAAALTHAENIITETYKKMRPNSPRYPAASQ